MIISQGKVKINHIFFHFKEANSIVKTNKRRPLFVVGELATIKVITNWQRKIKNKKKTSILQLCPMGTVKNTERSPGGGGVCL